MYKWYQNAVKCYVYLFDVSPRQKQDSVREEAFYKSVWFTRGWTLQELIAPRVVEFFSIEGTKLGDKRVLEQQIHKITDIPNEVLQGKPLSQITEQERFAWSTGRDTTVEEDATYCLLGIFDVHMPLIYGEGQRNALMRLQREIKLLANPDLYDLFNSFAAKPTGGHSDAVHSSQHRVANSTTSGFPRLHSSGTFPSIVWPGREPLNQHHETAATLGTSVREYSPAYASYSRTCPSTKHVAFTAVPIEESDGRSWAFCTITAQSPYQDYSLEELRLADLSSSFQSAQPYSQDL